MLQVLPNLNEIDLLPADYRKRGVQRRAYLWRVVVVAVFAAFFISTALMQRKHHAEVLAKFAEVELQYAQAMLHNAKSANVKGLLLAERSGAELLTFLRHPWPRTQILAATLEPITDSITLTDWQILHETVQRPVAQDAPPPGDKKPPTDKPSRRARDLARSLTESAGRQPYVYLAGFATEAAALHEYLARLGANPLFVKIDLRSMENLGREKTATPAVGAFHFTARAILRPAHGQGLIKPATPTATPLSGAVALNDPPTEVAP